MSVSSKRQTDVQPIKPGLIEDIRSHNMIGGKPNAGNLSSPGQCGIQKKNTIFELSDPEIEAGCSCIQLLDYRDD